MVHRLMSIVMVFNTNETVCMIFNPLAIRYRVSDSFPPFNLAGSRLSYVSVFKYLGQLINNELGDDDDINKELKCIFTRTNILIRRFAWCSRAVKLRVFRSYCLCFYNIALWKNVKMSVLNRLKSAYVKCLKMFFNFDKYSICCWNLVCLALTRFYLMLIVVSCACSKQTCSLILIQDM